MSSSVSYFLLKMPNSHHNNNYNKSKFYKKTYQLGRISGFSRDIIYFYTYFFENLTKMYQLGHEYCI